VSDSSARYDDIGSGVLWRVTKACLSWYIPEDVSDQEARLNTWVRNSRVDAYRRTRIYDFGAELDQLIPPISEATDADVLDVVHKKATTPQRIVFDLLAQGLIQEEVAERIGKSTATVNNEKQTVEALLKQEIVIPQAGSKRDEVKRSCLSPAAPAETGSPPSGKRYTH